MLNEITRSWCIEVPVDPTCRIDSKLLAVIAGNVFGLLSAIGAYRSAARLKIVMLGYRAYRQKRNFPDIH